MSCLYFCKLSIIYLFPLSTTFTSLFLPICPIPDSKNSKQEVSTPDKPVEVKKEEKSGVKRPRVEDSKTTEEVTKKPREKSPEKVSRKLLLHNL